MKGLVKLTPESLIALTNDCMDYINNFDIEPCKKTEKYFNLWKMRKEERIYYNCPFWYQYKDSLKRHFYELYKVYENAVKHNDEIWISELSYNNMCLLKSGDRHANPIYITNY